MPWLFIEVGKNHETHGTHIDTSAYLSVVYKLSFLSALPLDKYKVEKHSTH